MLFDPKKFRAALPPEMLKEKRWVRYFLKAKPEGGTAKIPLGSHSDPNTWRTFDECVAAIDNDQQGIGYNFLGGDIHGLDIDHCRNARTGVLCNEAMLLLSRIPSWAEYSVSGQGLHVLFKGNVRGKSLSETCLQYWNPKNSPRFFAITCDMVGDAFTNLKDVGEDFNYIFATARHISAKIREELKAVDYEQWAALPKEREPIQESVSREKSKSKTRKVVSGFDLKDFLNFYGIPIDNECDNELGRCTRVSVCPIKDGAHMGQNSTTTNFIYPTADGGLAFHCQSTGCVEYGIGDVIKLLAKRKGVYPKPIYEKNQKGNEESQLIYTFDSLSDITEEVLQWLWPGFLPQNKLVHFVGASSEGKSPTVQDIIARVTRGKDWPDGAKNDIGPRSVLLMAGEDDLADTVVPRLRLAGADLNKVKLLRVTLKKEDKESDLALAINRDYEGLMSNLHRIDDLALIVIDPITNYLGGIGMNKEDELRQHISMPLRELAGSFKICVITVGHLNKRDKDTPVLQRAMGAAAFTGVPRKVFVFGPDPETDEKHTHVMKEVRDNQVAIQYKTVGVTDPEGIQKSPIVQVEWGKSVEVDAEELVNAPKQSDKSANKQVQVLLRTLLRDGAKPTATVEQAIKEQGIVCASWQRAAKRVAKCRKMTGEKTNGWEWYLPTPEQAEFDK